jgi:cytochrome c biogenesis protein CcmG, thiol:disulfide interchange protein DsbE
MTRGTRAAVLLGLAIVAAVLAGIALASLLGGDRRSGVDASSRASQGPMSLSKRLPATARGPLPDVVLPGFAGRPDVALASYRGRPLVVNLWATWCEPCIQEMPAFQQVATDTQGKVAFLGVNEADDPDAARAFVAKLGITYDLATDPNQGFFDRTGAYGMPTTLFVDPQGTIAYRHTGPLDGPKLRRLLAEHLSFFSAN